MSNMIALVSLDFSGVRSLLPNSAPVCRRLIALRCTGGGTAVHSTPRSLLRLRRLWVGPRRKPSLLGQFYLSIIWDGPDDRLSDQASHYNSHRCGGNGCRSSTLCSRRWRPSPRRNSHMGFVMRRSSHWRIARNSFIPTSVVRTDRLALLPQALM
jgi:hypothetical protein